MPQKYKLTYFPVKGLGEQIRFLLAYLGEDFEDHRFNREDWPTIKPTTPWGQVPMLEVDGKVVCQSTPITRYLAREAGLCGKDNWEDLKIDEIVEVISDFRTHIAKYHYENDENKKESVKEPLFKEIVPYYLPKLAAHVKENNGYLANGKLSWADLFFAAIIDNINFMLGFDITKEHPSLKALKEKVYALPKIKAWVDKRPQTER